MIGSSEFHWKTGQVGLPTLGYYNSTTFTVLQHPRQPSVVSNFRISCCVDNDSCTEHP